MATVMRCDACGRIYSGHEKKHTASFVLKGCAVGKYDEKDLCPLCTEKVRKFIDKIPWCIRDNNGEIEICSANYEEDEEYEYY